MRDDSDSARLEQLLRRQESKRYQPLQRQSLELEQLSIVRRPDQRYQIVLRFNQQLITHQVFRTLVVHQIIEGQETRSFQLHE